jgi:hypothetical protein
MSLHKKKSKNKYKDDFTVEEDEGISICNLIEGEPIIEGNILKSFSFEDTDQPTKILPNSNAPLASSKETLNIPINSDSSLAATALTYNEISPNPSHDQTILDHRTSTANPNGRTPPVDGEVFDMIRTYTLRRSTVRILSKIKAIHMDDNVYLNTIVDEAIRHYYHCLKNNLND